MSSDLSRPVARDLPLVDLHLHQERSARLNQVFASAGEEPRSDWHEWLAGVQELTPGMSRLNALWNSYPTEVTRETPEATVARFRTMLREACRVGAVLAEVRIGNETLLTPDIGDLFREAERQVRVVSPHFRAGLVGTLKLWHDAAEVGAALAAAVENGLGGIDFVYVPYETAAEWTTAYRLADRAASAGLGVTAHAGEFSSSNISAALRLPGVSRIGHAVHATDDPRLLDELGESRVAVEVCLTSNVVLGAVPSLADHPLRSFLTADIPIVLGTDNPLQFQTDIAREYALGQSLGFTQDDMRKVSRRAVELSFVSERIKVELLSLPQFGVDYD